MVETTGDLNNTNGAPPKSAKQLEKEAKKLAKLEKFKQKQDKKETNVGAVSKSKDKPEVKNLLLIQFLLIIITYETMWNHMGF